MLPAVHTDIKPFPGQEEGWMLRPLHKVEYHLFEHRGIHILFDVHSGIFFQADQVILSILDLCEGRSLVDLLGILRYKYPEKDIVSAFRELYLAGILLDSPQETHPFVPPGRLEIVYLGLDITYDRLSDNHHFARSDATALAPATAYMDDRIARKAIDLLMAESGRIKQCHVTFQGGDPLLNPQLVEKTIHYGVQQARAAGKDIFFEVFSDGRLLNEQLLAVLRKQNADIAVKIDSNTDSGLSLFHGSGPYSLSPKEAQEYASETDARIHLNGTVDRNNLNLGEQIHEHLTNYPSARSIALRFSALSPNHPAAITRADMPTAIAGIEDLAECVRRHVLSGKRTWIGEFEDAIFQVYNRKISLYHCGAGTRYITVAPDGKLYVCPGLTGNSAFCLGDLDSGIDQKLQRAWTKSTHVEKFPSCASCWTRYLCGGGCKLSSFLGSEQVGEPNPVSCKLSQHTYELAMATCLDIASEDPAQLEQRYAEDLRE